MFHPKISTKLRLAHVQINPQLCLNGTAKKCSTATNFALTNTKSRMKDYTYSFITTTSAEEVFKVLLDVKKWWSGVYEETIEGKSENMGDEFSFSASGGRHFSKQKLGELLPAKKIAWHVTESNLSFLQNPREWDNTKLAFNLSEKENKTQVTFTHKGLVPQIECYDACSHAWTQYLQNLKSKLKGA